MTPSVGVLEWVQNTLPIGYYLLGTPGVESRWRCWHSADSLSAVTGARRGKEGGSSEIDAIVAGGQATISRARTGGTGRATGVRASAGRR